MNSNPLVSIICPVYNSEKTVAKMIESVLSQSYKNWQLIITDDLSSDSTADIVYEYAAKDSRIVLIRNKKNLGPGPSKNYSISIAKGDFITFIDGDDWVESDTYSLMIENQQNTDADVVVVGYNQDFLDINGNLKYSVEVLPPLLDGSEQPAEVFAKLDSGKVFSFCWTKLFKTRCIKETNAEFPSLMHSEDFFFNMNVLPCVKKTVTVQKSLYHYIKPVTQTLTTSEYIDDFYSLSNRRYNACKNYCVSQKAFENSVRTLVANTHIKHLSMCLNYNCSPKSNMNHVQRVEFARKLLKDKNTTEALHFCSANTRVSKILNSFFKMNNPYILVMLGRMIWICKQKFSFLFDKSK